MPLITLPTTDLLSPGTGEPVEPLGSREAPPRWQDFCSSASAVSWPTSLPQLVDQLLPVNAKYAIHLEPLGCSPVSVCTMKEVLFLVIPSSTYKHPLRTSSYIPLSEDIPSTPTIS